MLKYSLILSTMLFFNACSTETVTDKEISKKKDMFYFLNKNTNNVEDYPQYNYQIITIDLEDTTKEEIQNLHNKNIEVICYFSAGTYENWRKDKNSFPEEAIGLKLGDWEGENWLNIRDQRIPNIMKKRIDMAYDKKCDGVDFDNINEHQNETGFGITFEEQLLYTANLAQYAKLLNLKTTLKNAMDQINELEKYFDYAVNESCNQYNECDLYEKWLEKKPVFNIEYKKQNNYYKHKNFHTYLMDLELKGEKYIKIGD